MEKLPCGTDFSQKISFMHTLWSAGSRVRREKHEKIPCFLQLISHFILGLLIPLLRIFQGMPQLELLQPHFSVFPGISCGFFPGISEFASSPDKVSDYISPLLSFAAEHVPRSKHKETPLYILCTAGMRILPER